MNKKEFISAIAEKANLSLEQANVALQATFDIIQMTMVSQESIAIPGFGSFSTKVRKERTGRNPSTGKGMVIPEAIVPLFKAGSQLKESVNTVAKNKGK